MKDINKIKMLVNKLNQICDKSSISILDVLNKKELLPIDFFSMLGIDKTLLDESTLNTLKILLEALDTRIIIDSSSNVIEIYSKSLQIDAEFSDDKLTIIYSNEKEDEENIWNEEEFKAIRLNDGFREEIHFELETKTLKSNLKTRMITQKYYLAHVALKGEYKNKDEALSFGITLNNDMLASDLNYLKRLLYNFNLLQAKNILSNYPACIKIMADEVNLHNFNK